MSAKSANTTLRDIILIVGMVAVFATAYALIKEPQTIPLPPGAQQPNHAGGMTGASMPDLPADYDGLVVLGNRNMDDGNYSVAAECYRRALEINGESPDVHTDFGACLSFMGLPERALEEFKLVIAAHPEHAMSRFNAGVVSGNMGNDDAAIGYFEEYLKMDPNGRAADMAKNLLSDIKKKKQ